MRAIWLQEKSLPNVKGNVFNNFDTVYFDAQGNLDIVPVILEYFADKKVFLVVSFEKYDLTQDIDRINAYRDARIMLEYKTSEGLVLDFCRCRGCTLLPDREISNLFWMIWGLCRVHKKELKSTAIIPPLFGQDLFD